MRQLYNEDVNRIEKAGYNKEEFVYTDNLGNKYTKDKGGWCMFLKKGKTSSCIIYDLRPKICRLYPTRLINGSCKPEELVFDRYLEKRIKS